MNELESRNRSLQNANQELSTTVSLMNKEMGEKRKEAEQMYYFFIIIISYVFMLSC